jgi:hypothetical protein
MLLASVGDYVTPLMTSRLPSENWGRSDDASPRWDEGSAQDVGARCLTAAHGDRGMAVADFWRLTDGRIVEHWDVVQEVPEHSANDNTMF